MSYTYTFSLRESLRDHLIPNKENIKASLNHFKMFELSSIHALILHLEELLRSCLTMPQGAQQHLFPTKNPKAQRNHVTRGVSRNTHSLQHHLHTSPSHL